MNAFHAENFSPPLLFRPSCVIKSIVPACSTLEPFCINVPRSGGGDFSLAKVQGALCSGKNWLSFKKMRRAGGQFFLCTVYPHSSFFLSPSFQSWFQSSLYNFSICFLLAFFFCSIFSFERYLLFFLLSNLFLSFSIEIDYTQSKIPTWARITCSKISGTRETGNIVSVNSTLPTLR